MNGGGRYRYAIPGVDVPFDAEATDAREDGPERNGLAAPTNHRTAAGDPKKRKPAKTVPARMGAVWQSVEVVDREYETNPSVRCKNCNHRFAGGSARISDHIRAHCKGSMVIGHSLHPTPHPTNKNRCFLTPPNTPDAFTKSAALDVLGLAAWRARAHGPQGRRANPFWGIISFLRTSGHRNASLGEG